MTLSLNKRSTSSTALTWQELDDNWTMLEEAISSVETTPGPQGPAGPQGIPGLKGDTGLRGVPGVAGAAGARGPAGTNGINGTNGTNGSSSNIAGPMGPKGTNGAIGPIGPAGPAGISGATLFTTIYDVTSSRVKNTVYTNTIGKPIFIAVTSDTINIGSFGVFIVTSILKLTINSTAFITAVGSLTGIIPAGATYKVELINTEVEGATPTITSWKELY